MKVSKNEAFHKLLLEKKEFMEFFRHGSLLLELYRPNETDKQIPHSRDEVYIIVSGTGKFVCNEKITDFFPGDFLFVPAGAPHRFIDFTEEFCTWVIFYGPEGGESG